MVIIDVIIIITNTVADTIVNICIIIIVDVGILSIVNTEQPTQLFLVPRVSQYPPDVIAHRIDVHELADALVVVFVFAVLLDR